MRDLSHVKAAYLEWLLTPPADRQPPSKNKFAAEHGTTFHTLRSWEKNEAFRAEWQSRVDEDLGSPDKAKALLDTLYDKALAGDYKAADLWFKATGRMAPQPIKVETSHRIAELTDEELNALIAQTAGEELSGRG